MRPEHRQPSSRNLTRCLQVAAFGLAISSLAYASDLSVQQNGVMGGISNTGQYSALLDVASTCANALHATVGGTIAAGTYQGCSTLSSNGDVASGADVTLRAGYQVSLGNGFSVPVGATLHLAIQSSLFPDAWVQDNSPSNETTLGVRFYSFFDNLSLTSNGQEFLHFVGLNGAGEQEIRVGIIRTAGERHAYLEVLNDNGTYTSQKGTGNELLIPDGWQWIQVDWNAADGPGMLNGAAQICVTAAAISTPSCSLEITGVDNDQSSIASERWGVIDNGNNASLGSISMDDFESRSSKNVGPLP